MSDSVHASDCQWHKDWHACNCGTFEYHELIDTPLKDLIARYYAGDWENDPDGGAASAIVEGYKLGKSEESESHMETAAIMRRIRESRARVRTELRDMKHLLSGGFGASDIIALQRNELELLRQDIKDANMKLKERQDYIDWFCGD